MAYVRSFPLLARNPQICLAPLLASIVTILLYKLIPAENGAGFLGSANSGIASLLAQAIASFGFAVALIVGETAWRRGKAPFDDAWENARRKVGAIIFATLGFNFILFVAGVVGAVLGSFGAIALQLVAYVLFIYTLPAAAIGGIPGGAALNASVERAQRTLLATVVVTALYIANAIFVPTLVLSAFSPLLLTYGASIPDFGDVLSIAVGLVHAVTTGYVALVLAKAYDDASYGRHY